jgi:hypothetical protein
MYSAVGDQTRAAAWADYAEAYRERASGLLWDGVKFLHHVHLDEIDHGDFDESQQLAMGNTWAVTRGLATSQQAQAVIDEYHRRQTTTRDAYPWWSLQPGYPDRLAYFREAHRKQGGYANGGLMPWVGGELCLGAMENGREQYGVELFRQYSDHIRRTGGAQVWYWPDGVPGFRTTNEVDYAGWGMAQWIGALFEGIAGVRDRSSGLKDVTAAPRWSAAGINKAEVSVSYAAGGACFCYHYQQDDSHQRIRIEFSGSGEQVNFHALLPEGWQPVRLQVNHEPVTFQIIKQDSSLYMDFQAAVRGVNLAVLQCELS